MSKLVEWFALFAYFVFESGGAAQSPLKSDDIILEHARPSYSAETYEVVCGGVHFLVRNESTAGLSGRIGTLRVRGHPVAEDEISKILSAVPSNLYMSIKGFRCDLPSKERALIHVVLDDPAKPVRSQDIWFYLNKVGEISRFEGGSLPR